MGLESFPVNFPHVPTLAAAMGLDRPGPRHAKSSTVVGSRIPALDLQIVDRGAHGAKLTNSDRTPRGAERSPRQENTGSVSVAHPGKVRNVGGLDSASTPTGSSASSSSSKGSPSGWRATQLPSAHKIAAEARPVQAITYAPPSEAGARGTVVFTHARSRDAPSFTPISPTWPTLAATTPSDIPVRYKSICHCSRRRACIAVVLVATIVTALVLTFVVEPMGSLMPSPEPEGEPEPERYPAWRPRSPPSPSSPPWPLAPPPVPPHIPGYVFPPKPPPVLPPSPTMPQAMPEPEPEPEPEAEPEPEPEPG